MTHYAHPTLTWIPAFAGMTSERRLTPTLVCFEALRFFGAHLLLDLAQEVDGFYGGEVVDVDGGELV